MSPIILMSLSCAIIIFFFFFFSSRRRHTRFDCDWSSDVCSSDLVHGIPERVGQRSHAVLPGEREAGRGAAHRPKLVPAPRRGNVPLPLSPRGGRGAGDHRQRLRTPLPRGPCHCRNAFRRAARVGDGAERRAEHTAGGTAAGGRMSLTVCLAPANTLAYPNGGGHLWVYLHWALALKALGCRVIWLEGIDVDDSDTSPAGRRRRRGGRAVDCVATLKTRLEPYGLADTLALYAMNGAAVPEDVAQGSLDLDAAAGADLLLNLWHSAPAPVVQRFRRSAFIDTDPGLLQIWMTTGAVDLAPHDIYFTIGETVGQPGAPFPDGGRAWLATPPPIFLPEWPALPPNGPGPYTTVAHWWGGTFEYNGTTLSNEKRAAVLEYQDLPQLKPVPLELAVCLPEHYDEYRQLMEAKGWTLRG